MDIEGFYDENEARRESAEHEFGDQWTDAAGTNYELAWVEATGELYLMMEPEASITEDAFGDYTTGQAVGGLEVRVIATVSTIQELEERLTGWEEASEVPNSLAWLATRFPGS
jgi:hypothetical protein